MKFDHANSVKMNAAKLITAVFCICVLAASARAQDVVIEKGWMSPQPGHPWVITREYYRGAYVDPKLRYFYPAFQAVGDGDHFIQLGEPGWRMIKMGQETYVFGPGYGFFGYPYLVGPGTVRSAGRFQSYTGFPLAGTGVSFLLGLILGF